MRSEKEILNRIEELKRHLTNTIKYKNWKNCYHLDIEIETLYWVLEDSEIEKLWETFGRKDDKLD